MVPDIYSATLIQILDDAVCAWFRVNAHGKSMNQFYFLPIIYK